MPKGVYRPKHPISQEIVRKRRGSPPMTNKDNRKEFYGMKYPFTQCARPELLKMEECLDCSVRQFCKAPDKDKVKEIKDEP